ncbi:MAG TPA: response regulator transcription factor [Chitinophagaceae bacterium]|nr:response regulator transcription factor [Chitinophagaceae bacterium]
MKILVIEDEPGVASFIKKGLEEQSFIVDVAFDGQNGKQLALQNQYDIILLDVILPHINGLQLCKIIREHSNTPILMLTALSTTNDIVTGLDAGADGYLTKPFKFQELLARIRALVRRKNDLNTESNFTIADLEVDYRTKQLQRNGQQIKLTAREFYLLQYFIRNRGMVLSRADIAENVWDSSFDSGSNVVDVYINYLRNKIDKNFSPKLIHTVYGMGYIFKEDYNN